MFCPDMCRVLLPRLLAPQLSGDHIPPSRKLDSWILLPQEEVASRLKEYKEAGLYSRIWRLGPDLRMDTAPLQKPGSSFR